jgi:hypothetical protein
VAALIVGMKDDRNNTQLILHLAMSHHEEHLLSDQQRNQQSRAQ